MGSRDIDVYFDLDYAKQFSEVMRRRGFEKNGFPFRYEKIYNRLTKKYITQEESKTVPIYNLIYIFLDLFSKEESKILGSWTNLPPLETISFIKIGGYQVADINTLVALKCIALFARDKADKENKDACDLFALLEYSGKDVKPTKLLVEAIKKILNPRRMDLLYIIAEHVLLDPNRQNIVEVKLRKRFDEIQTILNQERFKVDES